MKRPCRHFCKARIILPSPGFRLWVCEVSAVLQAGLHAGEAPTCNDPDRNIRDVASELLADACREIPRIPIDVCVAEAVSDHIVSILRGILARRSDDVGFTLSELKCKTDLSETFVCA